MKLIDADKLQDWIDRTEFAFYGRYGETGDGVVKALGMLKERLDAGYFDTTPPVQPDIKPGDKVRHKDKRMKYLGIGNVLEISASGKTARVEWPNYDKTKCNWPPYPSYYRLDKLEVIPNE